jgi:hypothetical protein
MSEEIADLDDEWVKENTEYDSVEQLRSETNESYLYYLQIKRRSAEKRIRESSVRDRIECEDGFSMSVQAKPGTWCEPGGMDRYSPDFEPQPDSYTHVEVGFPSALEELLLPYAEDENIPTETVYRYVPAHLILTVISKHGGMVGGELPPLKSDD